MTAAAPPPGTPRPVVPFLSQSGAEERADWLNALPKALADIAEVRAFADLSEAERAAARVAIVANPDPAEVAALPGLVFVQSLWAGVERLVAELPETGPCIVRMNDPQMAATMSEAVLAWTLYLHRDMPRYAAQQRAGIWREHGLSLPQERRIAVLGLGHLGAVAARRLKENGFSVLGWSRTRKSLEGIDCHAGEDGLRAVLGHADIVVLLMPLTEETRGLMNAERLGVLRRGAALVNFARGPILDDTALLDALDSGRLSHAVLDVFAQEPLPEVHPFWRHDKVTLLPHISAPTIVSTASRIVAENLGRFFAEGVVPAAVDRTRGY